MTTANPEGKILWRTHKLIQEMAEQGVFVAQEGEPVRTVSAEAVLIWRVIDGGSQRRSPEGVRNIVLPGILVTPVSVEGNPGSGLNCADDETVRIVIQIVDTTGPGHREDLQTYGIWKNAIRAALTPVPNPFLQDSTVAVYDPFVVHILRRVPADAQSLVRNEQQVEIMAFQVMVRHNR